MDSLRYRFSSQTYLLSIGFSGLYGREGEVYFYHWIDCEFIPLAIAGFIPLVGYHRRFSTIAMNLFPWSVWSMVDGREYLHFTD